MATGQGRGISNTAADPYLGGTGGAAAGSPGSATPTPGFEFPSVPNPFDAMREAFSLEAEKTRKGFEAIAWTVIIGGGVILGSFVLVQAASAVAAGYGAKKAYDSGLLTEAGKAVAKGAKYL